jgi:Xaa-Pro dipeptidase
MNESQEWNEELARRRRDVWSIVEAHECDAALIYGSPGHAESFRYLTNFVPVLGDSWAVLRGPKELACVLNFNWQLTEARRRSSINDWYGVFDSVPTVVEALSATRPKRVGVVGLDRLSVTAHARIRENLPEVYLIDIGDEVTAGRRIKSPLEAEMLREASRITDAALEAARKAMRPGMTEFDLVAELAYTINRMGGELAFPPVVISGVDDPIPIRQPINRKIEVGDSVMIDLGAEYQGYQADASRTFVLGEVSPNQQKVWDVIVRAYHVALDLSRPGVACHRLHDAALEVVEEAGYRLVHRIGHGIGLATSFEWPSLDTEQSALQPGMTICIEPGIYVPGAGNMKLEDDVLITQIGHEVLTSASYDLVIPV